MNQNYKRDLAILKMAQNKITHIEIAETHNISSCTVGRILKNQGFLYKRNHYNKALTREAVLYYDDNDISLAKTAKKFSLPIHILRTAYKRLLIETGRCDVDHRIRESKAIPIDTTLSLVVQAGRYFHSHLLNCGPDEAIKLLANQFNIELHVAKKLYKDRRSTYVGSHCHAKRPRSPMKSIAAMCI